MKFSSALGTALMSSFGGGLAISLIALSYGRVDLLESSHSYRRISWLAFGFGDAAFTRLLSRLQKVLSQLHRFVSQKLPESTPAFFSRSRRLISMM